MHGNSSITVKQDINFLEYAMWILNERKNIEHFVINTKKGVYELTCKGGLPNRFDRLVLYFLTLKLFNYIELTQENCLELTLTRYEIARNLFDHQKSYGKIYYKRIMLALERWKNLVIKFDGVFYEGDGYTFRLFSVIDDIILERKTKKLFIRFNQQYVKQLQETKYYRYINIEDYKKLTRPISARLYEILTKSFREKHLWYIALEKLAEKLTLEKRANAKRYYPSDVLSKIMPSIKEINENTHVRFTFHYDKQTQVCRFNLLKQAKKAEKFMLSTKTILDKSASASKESLRESDLLVILKNYGFSERQVQAWLKEYSVEKINHKIELLKQSGQAVKNARAWLTKAIENDWDSVSYNKYLLEEKRRKEILKKQQELEAQKRHYEKLKEEFQNYKEDKSKELYQALSKPLRKMFDAQCDAWLAEQKEKYGAYSFESNIDAFKTVFYMDMLLEDEDKNFERWLIGKGYTVPHTLPKDAPITVL